MEKSQIIELETKLIEAIKTSDIDFLKNIMLDDLIFIAPNGQIVTKEMDLESHKSGTMKVESISHKFIAVHVEEDMAKVVVDYQTQGVMLGNPIHGDFRYLRFWKKSNNSWKIAGGSCHQIFIQ